MSFDPDRIIDQILLNERGYVDHPNDRGGPTNFGITQAVARQNGYTGPMQQMPIELARKIYLDRYILVPQFNAVAAVHEGIGMEVIDTGVNMGPARAAEFLQRWLNGFNVEGSRYADLFVDGRVGRNTIDALKAFLAWRGAAGATALLRGLNGVQAARYLELTEANKSQRAFLFGWVTNRVGMS